jgi:hypothetical protein
MRIAHPLPRALALIPLLAGMALLFGTAQAQTVPSAYRFIDDRMAVDLGGGYHTAGPGQLQMGPRSGPMGELRWGIIVSGPFSIDVAAYYMPTTRDVVDLSREESDQIIGESDSNLLGFVGELRFVLTGDRTWNRLAPYVMAGGGLVFDLEGEQAADLLLEDPNLRFDFGTSFLGRIGGGVLFLPFRRLEVRGDVALDLWKVETPVGWLEQELELGPLPRDEWVSGWAFRLGLGWRF